VIANLVIHHITLTETHLIVFRTCKDVILLDLEGLSGQVVKVGMKLHWVQGSNPCLDLNAVTYLITYLKETGEYII
jgi:hypothetical protein